MEQRLRLADISQSRQANFSRTVSTNLTRDRLRDPGHVFAKVAQPRAATAATNRRRIDHHPLAWEMLGERLALGALAYKTRTVVIPVTARSGASSPSVASASSSSNVSTNWSISRDDCSDRCP